MIYKIYKETNKGYQAECVVTNIDDMFIVLDVLILDENNSKVLVIERDEETQTDNVLYLFTGDIGKYLDYKDNFYYRYKR